jgi:hypothetical protein
MSLEWCFRFIIIVTRFFRIHHENLVWMNIKSVRSRSSSKIKLVLMHAYTTQGAPGGAGCKLVWMQGLEPADIAGREVASPDGINLHRKRKLPTPEIY